MADIVRINPKFFPTYWGLDYALPLFRKKRDLPPLNLALLAALTPAEHTVTIIDENVEPIDYERCRWADIVGVTGMAVQRARTREIITELKSRGVFTVLGRPLGDGQAGGSRSARRCGVYSERRRKRGRVFSPSGTDGRHGTRYEQADKSDMSTVPAPRFNLLPMRQYLYGSLQISRGCPFTCEFCDIIVVFGRRPLAPDRPSGHRGTGRAGRRRNARRVHRGRQSDWQTKKR